MADLVATSALLGHHVANLVADRTRTLLRHHVADLVSAGLLLRHHLAGLPAHRAGALFWNHVADLVAAGPLFWNHVANLVADRAATLFWHHVTDLVAVRLLLGNHVADLVAASLGPRFADPLGAADLFRLALAYPMLAAAFPRRALHTLGVALAWAIAAAARARIVGPRAWLANATGVRRTRNAVLFGFPMSARNLNRLGVVNRHHDVVADFAALGLPARLAHRVAAGLFFPARLADRVADFAALRFPARLADRVGAGLGFPARLADRVANLFAVVFPARMADRVATRFGLVARFADRVADLTRLGLPARLANRVAERLCFEARFADGVANFPRALLGHVLHTVNNAVFADPIPARLVACEALLFVFDAVHRFHNGVRLHLTTRVTAAVSRDTAEPGLCFGWDKRKRKGRG